MSYNPNPKMSPLTDDDLREIVASVTCPEGKQTRESLEAAGWKFLYKSKKGQTFSNGKSCILLSHQGFCSLD